MHTIHNLLFCMWLPCVNSFAIGNKLPSYFSISVSQRQDCTLYICLFSVYICVHSIHFRICCVFCTYICILVHSIHFRVCCVHILLAIGRKLPCHVAVPPSAPKQDDYRHKLLVIFLAKHKCVRMKHKLCTCVFAQVTQVFMPCQ